MADDAGQRSTDPVVVVGRVGKPLGVAGEVYVFADPDLADPFEPGAVYGVGDQQRVIVASRMHGDRLVVAFEGVHGREGAEAIRGAVVTRPREQVVLDEDTIWVADLMARTVVDPDGGLVGVVESVVDGHAHDYLVIARPDGGEALIPMVEQLVDWAADPIVVQPMPGLLDPDEAW